VSGRDHDKWTEAPFTREESRQVAAPIVAECKYALECTVVETLSLGAHDLFVARVLVARADESVLTKDGRLDMAALDPLAYVPHGYYRLGGGQLFGYGQSIREYDPTSRGALAYEQLAAELVRRTGVAPDLGTPVPPAETRRRRCAKPRPGSTP
jgi:hypothetical protein